MAEYLHGAYGQVNAVSARASEESQGAIVYVGTAPVNQFDTNKYTVNKPVLVRNIEEARKIFGYSDDWATYTLCEAMYVHFELGAVGPLVLINVLNPATHKSSTQTTASKTPANGKIVITDADDIIVNTVTVATQDSTPVAKTKGTDFAVSYDSSRATLTIYELTAGALGTSALTVSYYTVDIDEVNASAFIGTSDGAGTNTGLQAVKDVYQLTGYVPSYLLCPGFDGDPTIHSAMYAVSKKINKHWDAYMFVDIPITYNNAAVTISGAKTFKANQQYNRDNESVYFPMILGTDNKKYHLSVLAAANFQKLLLEQDGIPYRSASNTEIPIAQNIYMGAASTGIVVDDSIINEQLNKNGINSAAFIGGRWAIWGPHGAAYDFANQSSAPSYISVFETNTLMLYYISNDFQVRRMIDVDRPITPNDLRSIVSEEQMRLDALVNIGALTYGVVSPNAERVDGSDVVNGDFSFTFNVTATPLAKSLTAVVNWTDDGFETYFEASETE